MRGLIWDGTDLAGATIQRSFFAINEPGAVGVPLNAELATWHPDVRCPDETIAADNGNTCVGHFIPLP